MNSNTFGCNTWWTIPELSVDSELAIAIIQKYGFQAEDLKVPSRRLEVSRAVRSFHNRRTNDGRRIGERIRDTDSTVSYGILDRVVGVEEVNFEQGTKIILEKGSGTVTVSGIHKEEFDVALSDSVGKVTDEDVRYFLRRVIKKAYGVAKRPTGGIYFVPESKVEVMENASKCLKEFNTAAHIYIERVMNGVQERENVWESVQSDVESRLAEAVAAVGRIERRASALNNQAEKIGEAQELMEF